MKKTVLIIEDDKTKYVEWEKQFENKVKLIFANSISEAENQFTSNPTLDAIVVDACVPGDTPNTTPLVRKFRQTFTGPMIAISSLASYRRLLVEAGCDHESTKDTMPAKVINILGL